MQKREEKKKHNQFVALGVDSVALRHTLVYVWETLVNISQLINKFNANKCKIYNITFMKHKRVEMFFTLDP